MLNRRESWQSSIPIGESRFIAFKEGNDGVVASASTLDGLLEVLGVLPDDNAIEIYEFKKAIKAKFVDWQDEE